MQTTHAPFTLEAKRTLLHALQRGYFEAADLAQLKSEGCIMYPNPAESAEFFKELQYECREDEFCTNCQTYFKPRRL